MQVRDDRWFLEAFLIMPVRVPVADYRVSVHIKPWERISRSRSNAENMADEKYK